MLKNRSEFELTLTYFSYLVTITGYAPAGATILTLLTDYRVMGRAEKHLRKLIGLYGKVFSQSKEWFRKDLRRIVLERDVEALAREQAEILKDPYFVKMTEMFVASLKK